MIECLIAFSVKYKPVVELLTSLIPILLTALGIYIAVQQNLTAKRRLKLDLFERRIVVYLATRDYIGRMLTGGSKSHPVRQAFLTGTQGAVFLFDQEVKTYIEEVWDKSIDLENLSLDSPSEHSEERNGHIKWFNKQLSEIDVVFGKYMQLSH